MPEKVDFIKEKVDFGSQLTKFQSTVVWPCGSTVHLSGNGCRVGAYFVWPENKESGKKGLEFTPSLT